MPIIPLTTRIKSDIHVCFNLSRSIDLHKISTAHTHEIAIAGIITGLINLNETVTWQATHFGIKQKLTSIITACDAPFHFRDEQLKGPFAYFKHDHHFSTDGNFVTMKDVFEFQSPLSLLGAIVDKIVMTQYLTRLLVQRNKTIQAFAETERWKTVPGML